MAPMLDRTSEANLGISHAKAEATIDRVLVINIGVDQKVMGNERKNIGIKEWADQMREQKPGEERNLLHPRAHTHAQASWACKPPRTRPHATHAPHARARMENT